MQTEIHVGIPRGVGIASDPSILGSIVEPGIAMAIWERRVPSVLAELIAREDLNGFTGIRIEASIPDAARMIYEALDASTFSAEAVSVLGADIDDLMRLYADATGDDQIDIRLERITGDACRNYHADYVTARLLTTYRGQGTQWLDPEAGAHFLATGEMKNVEARSLGEGHVALLKGRLWAPDHALVHRSPPIAGSGKDRLLLAINRHDDASERMR